MSRLPSGAQGDRLREYFEADGKSEAKGRAARQAYSRLRRAGLLPDEREATAADLEERVYLLERVFPGESHGLRESAVLRLLERMTPGQLIAFYGPLLDRLEALHERTTAEIRSVGIPVGVGLMKTARGKLEVGAILSLFRDREEVERSEIYALLEREAFAPPLPGEVAREAAEALEDRSLTPEKREPHGRRLREAKRRMGRFNRAVSRRLYQLEALGRLQRDGDRYRLGPVEDSPLVLDVD